MSLHLITGYAGGPHITSADAGAFNACTLGSEDYVIQTGKCFEASIISNNQLRIYDGQILMQGRHVRIPTGDYEDVVIENGTQGMYRKDLIVARYEKNPETSIEKVSLVVLKGEPAVETAEDPSHITGDLLGENCTLHEIPLYRVCLNGINIEEVVSLFAPIGFVNQWAVGDVLITNKNENPAARFGGTWELIEKQLSRKYFSSETNAITANENTVSSLNAGLVVEGHILYLTVIATLKNDFADTNITIGSIDFFKIGITRLSEAGYAIGVGDDTNAMASLVVGMTNGTLTLTEMIPKKDDGVIKAGTKMTFQFVLMTGSSYLLDESCDKFCWKKIA